MLIRLGNVIYWTCCIIAALTAIVGIIAGIHENTGTGNQWEVFAFFEIPALTIWLFGKACRYVLANR